VTPGLQLTQQPGSEPGYRLSSADQAARPSTGLCMAMGDRNPTPPTRHRCRRSHL